MDSNMAAIGLSFRKEGLVVSQHASLALQLQCRKPIFISLGHLCPSYNLCHTQHNLNGTWQRSTTY